MAFQSMEWGGNLCFILGQDQVIQVHDVFHRFIRRTELSFDAPNLPVAEKREAIFASDIPNALVFGCGQALLRQMVDRCADRQIS